MAHYSKFTIQGFRSFKEKQELQLAIPNGKVGSGLTYIVGPNNTGKTTIIEGLSMKAEYIH